MVFERCKENDNEFSPSYEVIPEVVNELVNGWKNHQYFDHIGPIQIPSHRKVIEIIYQARKILFPGYFTSERLDSSNIEYRLGQEVNHLYDLLFNQISLAIQHECRRKKLSCVSCQKRGDTVAASILKKLPTIGKSLALDVKAAKRGDPASKSYDEIIFSYPGLFAIMVYRLANKLYRQNVPIIPRVMTEHAHSQTGIDIHPGATIGSEFFIDHGTGVVIGETCIIGDRVRIYQGVTLGALSLPYNPEKDDVNEKRHPTIDDDVVIYANTTILGGDTIIGKKSVVGGNNWITESIPANTKVLLKRPEMVCR